jgi:hypothetical protein
MACQLRDSRGRFLTDLEWPSTQHPANATKVERGEEVFNIDGQYVSPSHMGLGVGDDTPLRDKSLNARTWCIDRLQSAIQAGLKDIYT